MKKFFLSAAVLMLFSVLNVRAQKRSSSFSSPNYVTALGIKVFPPSGGAAITIKHFVNKGAAFEGLGYFSQRGGRVTGLYEFHWNIAGAPGLKWYVGPGAHIGFYNDKHYKDYPAGPSYVSFGLDGVLGLDYKFNNIPLNLSIDWQPSVDFGEERYHGYTGDYSGISARYTF